MINYEEFVNIVKGVADTNSKSCLMGMKNGYSHYSRYNRGEGKSEEDVKDFFFYGKGDIGGVFPGGSCWESSDPQPYSRPEGTDEAYQEFDKQFDAVCMSVCPDISFMKYKSLRNEVVEKLTETNYEYYGNSTEYLVVYCEIKKLYDKLVEVGLIS